VHWSSSHAGSFTAVTAAIGVVCLGGVALPAAAEAGGYGIDIQADYNRDGNPGLVANFAPNGGLATASWAICRPPDTRACVATGQRVVLEPGPTPAGTVFQAAATFHARTYTGRSAAWEGPVRAVAPPRLIGAARYRSRVVPRAGRWTGGWMADPNFKFTGSSSGGHGAAFDVMSVEACRTQTGHNCITVNQPHPVVGSWLTGRYLFAVDERDAYDTVRPAIGYGPIAPPIPLSATAVRSAPSGPVVGPPAPSASVLRRAVRRGNQILVAQVRCRAGCRVLVQVSDNRSGHSRSRITVKGTKLIGVPRGDLMRGPLTVDLNVGDYPQVIAGTSRLPHRR